MLVLVFRGLKAEGLIVDTHALARLTPDSRRNILEKCETRSDERGNGECVISRSLIQSGRWKGISFMLYRDADPTPRSWAPSRSIRAQIPKGGALGLEGMGMQMQDSCVVQDE